MGHDQKKIKAKAIKQLETGVAHATNWARRVQDAAEFLELSMNAIPEAAKMAEGRGERHLAKAQERLEHAIIAMIKAVKGEN